MRKMWILISIFLIFGGAGVLIGAANPEQAKSVEPQSSHSEQVKREPAGTGAIPEQSDSAAAKASASKVEEKQESAAQANAIGIAQGSSDSCLPDAGVLMDLKRRQSAIETKEKELKSKEADLKARESALNDELKKLDVVRKEISGIKAAKRQKNQEQVAKLVETLEKMSAKSAAPLLSKVDEELAVEAMGALSTPQLAKIMAAMEVNRSVRLSELMAMGEAAPARDQKGEGNESSKSQP